MADQPPKASPKPKSSTSPRSKDKDKDKLKKEKKNKMDDSKQSSSAYSSPGEFKEKSPRSTPSSPASPALASPVSNHDEPSDSIKRESFSAEKRRSKSKLSSSGSRPGLRHSMSSTLSRREQPLDTSDSVGEAAEDEGSPDLGASKSIARTTFGGKIVNPTRLTYGEVMKAWEKMTNIAQAPKRQEQYVTGKEVAQAILWDRKHGL